MYRITFNDGTHFDGGEPHASKWNEMPQKPIKKLEYNIHGKNIVMEGYEAYNHLIEHRNMIQGNNKINHISNLILMGKKGNDIFKIIYSFRTKKIKYDIVKFGKEYNNKPTTGWKPGIKSDKKPTCKIN